jgi:hypothetical protein
LCRPGIAQTGNIPYATNATAENRIKEYRNLVKIITENLSLDLADSTEENWQGAFYAMEFINYRSPWADGRIRLAFDSIEKRGTEFQRALLELLYANYPAQFKEEVFNIIGKTVNAKIFAMGAEYLYRLHDMNYALIALSGLKRQLLIDMIDSAESSRAILSMLKASANKKTYTNAKKKLKELFNPEFLSSQTVLYSIQRKNRNYPGIAFIRDTLGHFVKDPTGNIFSVPQLARSISNLPFYLTNGNTPQGIFRMDGFDISRSMAIGPTTNIQLLMPHETSPQYFLKDTGLKNIAWSLDNYKKMLPKSLQNDQSLYESFYAGKAGRTEIIAHGTTVNPAYYKTQPYYPLTPTLGCLATKEIWSNVDGKRMETDQQKLVDALKKAGGANGYCIVIEIDDQQKPVSMDEILSLLK